MQISLPLAIQLLSTGLFTAFGLYTLIYLIVSLFRKTPLIDRIDYEASRFISIVGAFYIFIWLISIFNELNTLETEDKAFLLNRMFGRYWIGFWTQPILYMAITQLLRIQKLRTMKMIRFIFSLLLMVSLERIVIMSISLKPNYHLSSWIMPNTLLSTNYWVLNCGIKLLIFLSFVGMYHIAKNKFKTMIS